MRNIFAMEEKPLLCATGNISIQDWVVSKDKGGNELPLPLTIKYVLDRDEKGNQLAAEDCTQVTVKVGLAEQSPTEVKVSGFSDTISFKGNAFTFDARIPERARQVIEEKVLPWLVGLQESGFRRPIVAKDRNGFISVVGAGYQVCWSCAYTTVNKWDGTNLWIMRDRNASELYFIMGGNRVGARLHRRFPFSGVRVSEAWARPAKSNGGYEDVKVTPDIEAAAVERYNELINALREAKRSKRAVSIPTPLSGNLRALLSI